MRAAVENLAVKDLGARQVRVRPITPTQAELLALSTTRTSQRKRSERTGSTSRSKQTKAKAPKQMAMEDGAMESDVGLITPVVQKNDDPDFDFDEVPISKIDFSNMGVYKDNEPSRDASDKGTEKGKGVMSYERELEEREKKLQSAEKILQRREHAVDIRLSKLEDRVVEARNEAQKWKRMYEDQAEIIRKLEVEREDAQANEAIWIITIDELNGHIKELEAKLNAQVTSDAE